MTAPTILVVDDNPIARDMIRAPLERQGYQVVEATTGETAIALMSVRRPALVIQDVELPDVEAATLLDRLRQTPGCEDTPVIALVPSTVRRDRRAGEQASFADVLMKPLEVTRLLHMVAAYLPAPEIAGQSAGCGRRILLTDDDPIQLKLTRIHLEQYGFSVVTADNGMDALAKARAEQPDAIVSDVLMPQVDGFRLCLAVRKDPTISHIPVLLTSAAYTEAADRRLAETVGANGLVVRTPDLAEVIGFLVETLSGDAPPRPHPDARLPRGEYAHRVIRQLERQADLNVSLSQRLERIVQTVPDGIAILAPNGQVTFANAAAEAILGLAVSDSTERLAADGEVADGRPTVFLDVPELMVALRRGRAVSNVEHTFEHPDGRRVIASINAVPLADGAGGPASIVLSLSDITERKRAEEERTLLLARERSARAEAEAARQRFAFLAEATSVLASSLDCERTLGDVARLVVPQLADACLIDLVDSSLLSRRVAIGARGNGASGALDEAATALVAPSIEAVLESGRPIFWPTPAERPWLPQASRAERCVPLPDASGLIVPMVAQGRVLGAITLLSVEPDHYQAGDLLFALDLARRAALSVDSARLYSEAQAAIRVRDEFVASASHDLKTPLTVIKGNAQLLRRWAGRLKVDNVDSIVSGLERIDTTASKMLRLIEEMLDIASVRMGRPLRLSLQSTDLAALTRDLASEYTLASPSCRISLTGTADSLIGVWDAGRIERAVSNLLDNAIKYSPAGSEIELSIGREEAPNGEWAVLEVRDRGVGIPTDELPFVFERFHRAHNVGKVAGTGLGLAGVRRIVEEHGGTIEIESAEQVGTTVRVRLPLAGEAVRTVVGAASGDRADAPIAS